MLKYKDLYDYVIGVLYELKKTGQTGYFSLKEILENLRQNSTLTEIYGIGKYLEAEGYIKAEFSLGDVFIEITPSGIVYLENKGEDFLRRFEDFQKEEKNQTRKTVTKLTEKSIIESRKPLLGLINQVINILGNSELKDSDLHLDAKILKLEVEKINPDKEIIQLKTSNLEQIQISGLRDILIQIRDYLNFVNSNY